MIYEIGDRIIDDTRDLTILDKKYKYYGKYKTWFYKYHCNICGYECEDGYIKGKFAKGVWMGYSAINKGCGCRCCTHKIIIPTINSIRVTHPELSRYFIDDEDMYYSICSNVNVKIKCPDCNYIINDVNLPHFYSNGFHCPICNTTRSVGEKIVGCLLNKLNISFIREYCFPNQRKRYDYYIPDKECIIEVNGKQHYGESFLFNKISKTINQEQIDKYKYDYAIEHGISDYIIIDARISSFDYIVDSIKKSKLAIIYDLSNIVWDDIKKEIFEFNITKEVCDYYNQHPDITLVMLEKKFCLSEATIRSYLKIGDDVGWCNYQTIPTNNLTKEVKHKIKGKYKREKPLFDMSKDTRNNCRPLCYLPEKIFFKSIRLCRENIEKYIGKSIPDSTMRYKLNRDDKDFKYITKREFNNAYNNGEKCYGEPFDEAIVDF